MTDNKLSPAVSPSGTPSVGADRWWRHAVGYEVYLRSFADGNGDGIGDLVGLHDRLDHLAWLGVDILWITPFYQSPMADFGYDVADYTAVHPVYGDLAAFDRLIGKAKTLDIRVVIDLVPNHSSDQHAWFRSARTGRDSEHRDYYIWRDPAPDGGPPNNWITYFGGPAWTLDDVSGQYYLHLFLPEQPDLNWRNPAIADEFDAILRFWLDRGIDGFRIDVAQALVKDEQLRSNPQRHPIDPAAPRWDQWHAHEHRYDICQPESIDIFRRWRRITDSYGAVLIGETYVVEPHEIDQLLAADDGLDVGFWFPTMAMDWDPHAIHAVLTGPSPTVRPKIGWVQSSHDEVRAATRFGGGDLGRRRSLALAVLLFGLPGTPFLYQGEELGLVDGLVPPEAKADPIGGDDPAAGRDGCRTPIPWDSSPNAGFSTAEQPWLPIGHRGVDETVAGQRSEPGAIVHRYRHLLEVRRSLPELATAPVEFREVASGVLRFDRGDLAFVLNAGTETVALPDGSVLFHTTAPPGGLENSPALSPDSAAIVALPSRPRRDL